MLGGIAGAKALKLGQCQMMKGLKSHVKGVFALFYSKGKLAYEEEWCGSCLCFNKRISGSCIGQAKIGYHADKN